MKRSTGFTLVEILVVLVILAISTTFVTLGFQRLENERLTLQAGKLSMWLQNISDQSVLDSSVYGIFLDEDHQLLQAKQYWEQQWLPVGDRDLSSFIVSHVDVIELRRGEGWKSLGPSASGSANPELLLLPTGLIQPDGIRLHQQHHMAEIVQSEDGVFVWSLKP